MGIPEVAQVARPLRVPDQSVLELLDRLSVPAELAVGDSSAVEVVTVLGVELDRPRVVLNRLGVSP